MKYIILTLLMLASLFASAQLDSTYESEMKKIDSTYNSDYVEKTLFVPNAFAPESAPVGIRVFKPVGTNLVEYEIHIFDSKGNIVWHSNKLINGNPAESWDGMYNGILLKSDVYIWKITEVHFDKSNYTGGFYVGINNGYTKSTHFGSIFLIR